MDRWSERDDNDSFQKRPQGRVALEGIGAFVKQDNKEQKQNINVPATQGKIEIVASRREQKQQQAAAAMPPPPSRMLAQSHRTATGSNATTGSVPSGCYIDVIKSGETVQNIPLMKERILVGRSQEADIFLEHPSSSRQHAIIVFQANSSQWALVDSGSAHGTFVNNKQLAKGVLAILQPGIDKFSFGASTRGYMLQQTLTTQTTGTHIKRNGDALPTQASKRHRADVGNDTQLDSSTQLHEAEGQFANVVRSEIRPAQAAADLSSPSLSNKVREAESVRTKPDFQKFVSSHLKRPPVSPGGLYDMLPPEKSRQYH